MNTIEGNLLDQKGILVHGCNCHGVMGSGVAAGVRSKYPHVFQQYRERYERQGLHLGEVQLCVAEPGVYLANAMTQFDFGSDKVNADYPAIRECFKKVKLLADALELPVYYPLIGCGLAGGDWNVVSAIIEEELGDMDHTLVVFKP